MNRFSGNYRRMYSNLESYNAKILISIILASSKFCLQCFALCFHNCVKKCEYFLFGTLKAWSEYHMLNHKTCNQIKSFIKINERRTVNIFYIASFILITNTVQSLSLARPINTKLTHKQDFYRVYSPKTRKKRRFYFSPMFCRNLTHIHHHKQIIISNFDASY